MFSKLNTKIKEFLYLKKIKKEMVQSYYQRVNNEYQAMKSGDIDITVMPIALALSPTQLTTLKLIGTVLDSDRKNENIIHEFVSSLASDAITKYVEELINKAENFQSIEEVAEILLTVLEQSKESLNFRKENNL